MISVRDFSLNRLDQHWLAGHPFDQLKGDICVFYSYAVAVSPLAHVDEQDLLCALDRFVRRLRPNVHESLGLPLCASGYDGIQAMHNQCKGPKFAQLRKAVDLRRIGSDLTALEAQLRDARATSMLALSYPHGRPPHSIVIAYDSEHGFFVRDSTDPSGWSTLPADATGASIVEAVRNRDATAICGDAILFTEKVVST